MIQLLFVWLFINSINPADSPQPLYGAFKTEPKEQLNWLKENKHKHFICSLDFKKVDKGNNNVADAKKAAAEMIKKESETDKKNKQVEQPGKNEKRILPELQPSTENKNTLEDKAKTSNLDSSMTDVKSDELKRDSTQLANNENLEKENLNKDTQSNNLDSGHQKVKKEEEGLDNTSAQNKQDDDKIDNNEKEAKPKSENELNDTVKEDGSPFNYIVKTDCKGEHQLKAEYECNKFKGFYINNIAIDAEKTINEEATRYYLSDLDQPRFSWDKETCVLSIYSSRSPIMPIIAMIVMTMLSF